MVHIFASALGTSRDTGIWMVPLDSASQIGLSTFSREVLTVDQGGCRWGLKNRDIRDIFASALGTSRDTWKRIA